MKKVKFAWLSLGLMLLVSAGCSQQPPTLAQAQAVIFSKTQAELDAAQAAAAEGSQGSNQEANNQKARATGKISASESQVESASAQLLAVNATRVHFDPVSEAVEQMVQQLTLGLKHHRVQRFPMAISPFVALERSSERYAGPMGERLSESFIYQMQQTGFNMLDYRAVSLLTTFKDPINRQNMSALRNSSRVYFLLTGTYSRYPDGLVVNARVLDTTTRQVLASAQTHIPDVRLEGALPGYNPLLALEKGMIIENELGPAGMNQ
ncbi:MAG: FlgO family outer membrane protein [Pontibacterium sp.]